LASAAVVRVVFASGASAAGSQAVALAAEEFGTASAAGSLVVVTAAEELFAAGGSLVVAMTTSEMAPSTADSSRGRLSTATSRVHVNMLDHASLVCACSWIQWPVMPLTLMLL
jgi:hypothetical protein